MQAGLETARRGLESWRGWH